MAASLEPQDMQQNTDICVNASLSTSLSASLSASLSLSSLASFTVCGDFQPNETCQELMTDEQAFLYYLWTFVTPIIFSVIFVAGTVGNLLVIFVILSQPHMRNVTNFLLVNLALADIAFLLVCVPATTLKYATLSWPFGKFPCQAVQYLLYVTLFVTVYTLVAVSALRFMIVVHSKRTLRYRTRRNVLLVVSTGIWVGSLSAGIPIMLAHTVKRFDYLISYCGIVDEAIGYIISSFFVFGYALPLAVISLLYLFIMLYLRSGWRNSTSETCRQRRNSRTMRMIVVVVLVFGVSWLPTHAQWLAIYFRVQLPDGVFYEVMRIVWHCMAYGNSCANPLIYHHGSENFRKGFRKMYMQCRWRVHAGRSQRLIKRFSRVQEVSAYDTVL